MAKPVLCRVVCFGFVLASEIFICKKAGKEEREIDNNLTVSAPSALGQKYIVSMAISASAWPTFFHLPAIVRSVHKHKLVTQGDASLTLWLLPANRTIFTVVIQSKLASPSTRQDVCIAEMNSSAVWVLSARS